MLHTPLIVFAFAHERSESKPPVRNLLKEQLQVTSLVSPLVQQKLCETQALVNVNVDRLNELISREGHRLIGLHYASDVATLLRAREGKEKSMERALKGKLGRKLGALPHLRWLFLSGDGSQEQAEALIKAGIPLVVRSHNLINDDAAFRLAYFFYQSLGQGHSLGKACENSMAEVRRDYVNKAKLTYEHEPPSGYGSDWPFAYHVNPYVESPLWWGIQNAQGQAEASLPNREVKELPALPFTDLNPLNESYANLFVGKEEELRSIYEVITSNAAPSIIVVSGAKKSGKSSFLTAGLSPLFNQDYQYRYQSFTQDALTSLSTALSADEDLSLMRTWIELEGGEKRTLLQPQMITELMNEAQSSFRTHYRSEKADFTQFLRAIRAMWIRDEIGDGDNLLVRLGDLFDQQSKLNTEEAEENTDLRPLVVCLDHIERLFQCDTTLAQRRHERFWEVLQQLCYNPDRALRGGIILGVTAEYTTEVLDALRKNRLSFTHISLPKLERKTIEHYIQQLRSNNRLKEHFPMMLDEQLPNAWSQLLETVPSEELGDCFHEMFRKIWRSNNKRPLLLNTEKLLNTFPEAPSLKRLLLDRVREFTALMRAQGDDELSDHFALDLIYRMVQARSEDALAEVEIESLLQDYLSWETSLPNPWGNRQKVLGDQSLWVITQAIDLGIFRGQIKAGIALPSGTLHLSHPLLEEVIKEEWEHKLGHFGRAIVRMADYAQAQLVPSSEDLNLATNAFKVMRLPTMIEAELLLKGLATLEETQARTQVSSKRDQLIQLILVAGLILTMGRCAQIGGEYEDIAQQQYQVDDQLRLLAAEKSFDEGEVDLAAALLNEVQVPEQRAAWMPLALKTLNQPLASSRVVSPTVWSEAVITPQALQVRNESGEASLWSGKEYKMSHNLGPANLIDYIESGQRWVTFDDGILSFWSLDQEQGTSKRLPQSTIKDLAINHEGTIAAVLNHDGQVKLYRSYEYPIKSFTGLNGSRIKSIEISPDRLALLMIDDSGSVQSVNLVEGQLEFSIPAKANTTLLEAKWLGGLGHQVIALHKDNLGNDSKKMDQVLSLHQVGQEPKTIYQSKLPIQKVYYSPYQAQIALEGKSASNQVSFEIFDLSQQQPQSLTIRQTRIKTKDLIFDPSGQRVIFHSAKAQQASLLYSIKERSRVLELKSLNNEAFEQFLISPKGEYILGRTAEGISEWNALTGRLLQNFSKAKLKPLAMRVIADKLHVALSDQQSLTHAELLTWRLDDQLLSTTISNHSEEMTYSLWHNQALITSNQSGEIAVWDLTNLSQKLRFMGHQKGITKLALHPSRKSFYSGAVDGSLSLWSIDEGRALARLEGHESGITTLSTISTSKGIYTASGDQKGWIWYWNELGKAEAHWKASRSRIEELALAPEADYLIVRSANRNEAGAIWKLSQGEQAQKVAELPNALLSIQWQGQGSELSAYGLTETGDYIRWQPRNTRVETVAELSSVLGNARLSKAKLNKNSPWLVGVTKQGQAVLHHLEKRQTVVIPTQGKVQFAEFMEGTVTDEPKLVLGGLQGQLWLWQDQQVIELDSLQGPLTGVESSEDGLSFVARSEEYTQVWDQAFDQASIKKRVLEKSQVCLNVQERIKRLDESKATAEARAQSCAQKVQELKEQSAY